MNRRSAERVGNEGGRDREEGGERETNATSFERFRRFARDKRERKERKKSIVEE